MKAEKEGCFVLKETKVWIEPWREAIPPSALVVTTETSFSNMRPQKEESSEKETKLWIELLNEPTPQSASVTTPMSVSELVQQEENIGMKELKFSNEPSTSSHEIGSDKGYMEIVNEVQKPAMTAVAKLVWEDTHNKLSKIEEETNVESLSLAFENIYYVPFDIIEKYSPSVKTLDLSNNRFSRNLQFLSEFDNLTSLILDHNQIEDCTKLPYMPKLEFLWLHYNSIRTLYPFLKHLNESMPNLKYLSLIGNEAAVSSFCSTQEDFCKYLEYRLYVISWFPNLLHLDDERVTLDEHKKAKIFKRSRFDDFINRITLPKCIRDLHNRITNIIFRDRFANIV